MGISGKWLRTLVGLRKSEKSQNSGKDENVGKIAIAFCDVLLPTFAEFYVPMLLACYYLPYLFGNLFLEIEINSYQ